MTVIGVSTLPPVSRVTMLDKIKAFSKRRSQKQRQLRQRAEALGDESSSK